MLTSPNYLGRDLQPFNYSTFASEVSAIRLHDISYSKVES